jgi:Beta-propeller repeat
MLRPHRLIGLVGLILLVTACRESMEPSAYSAARPVASTLPSGSNDPVLFFSTYLGGSGDDAGRAIAVDAAGNAYVTGSTTSTNFPTTSGAFQPALAGSQNVFVTKLNPTGSGLVYSTYLGGSGLDFAQGIALDALGNAYMIGFTTSTNFPVAGGAYQSTFGGGPTDAFVTKLNAAGSALVYSTYLGGSSLEDAFAIAVDAAGNAYVTGGTESTNFPTTPGAFQTTLTASEAGFVTKLNPGGSGLVYSTYFEQTPFGGAGFTEVYGVAVDPLGDAYITGHSLGPNLPTTSGAFQTTASAGDGSTNAFVTKLNPFGTGLIYSTYLSGSGGNNHGGGLAVDAVGNAYVVGTTGSANFPTTAGAFQTTYGGGTSDGFVTKVNPTGTGVVYSTYLGGSSVDGSDGIALDVLTNAYVTGLTGSTNFPVTSGAPQSTFGGGTYDAFVTQLNPSGSGLVYSTYLGGSGGDYGGGIALDGLPNPNAYITGVTGSMNFPTTAGAFQTSFGGDSDAFVTKIANIALPPPTTAGKVTGGGTIGVAGGIGTFGFIVQAQTNGGPVSGDLQYVNHASGANVHSLTFTSLVIAAKTATFSGTCTKNGAPCTFTVNVTDNGEPGVNDSFVISVDGGAPQGGTLLSGNIQIQQSQ